MIYGIGTDMTTIERFVKWISNNNMCSKYFSEKELEYIKSKGSNASQSMAAGFAAKEAFGKALGTGLRGFSLKEISVLRDQLGKPYFYLEKRAKEILLKCGENPRVHLSLSHEDRWAIAQVVIEVDND